MVALCTGEDAAAQLHGAAPRPGKGGGFAPEWKEKAYQWILGRHFEVTRIFSKGPFRRFGPVFDMAPDGEGGPVVTYALEWQPLTLTGRLFGKRLGEQAGAVVGKCTVEAVAYVRGDGAGSLHLRRRRQLFLPARPRRRLGRRKQSLMRWAKQQR